jgi:hypothetical protein
MQRQAKLEREKARLRSQTRRNNASGSSVISNIDLPQSEDEYIESLQDKETKEITEIAKDNNYLYQAFPVGKYFKIDRKTQETVPTRPFVKERTVSRRRNPPLSEIRGQYSLAPSRVKAPRVTRGASWETSPDVYEKIRKARLNFCPANELYIEGTSCRECSESLLPHLLKTFRLDILKRLAEKNSKSFQDLTQQFPDEKNLSVVLKDLSDTKVTQEIVENETLSEWQKNCLLLKKFLENPEYGFFVSPTATPNSKKINPEKCGACVKRPYSICMSSYCHTCPLYEKEEEKKIPAPAEDILLRFFRLYGSKWKNRQSIQDLFRRQYLPRYRLGRLHRIDPVQLHRFLFQKDTPSCSSLLTLQSYPDRITDMKDPAFPPISKLPYKNQSCYCDAVLTVWLAIPNDYTDTLLDAKEWKKRLDVHNLRLKHQTTQFVDAEKNRDVKEMELRLKLMKRIRKCNLTHDLETKKLNYVTEEMSYLDEIFKATLQVQAFLRNPQEQKGETDPSQQLMIKMDKCPQFENQGVGFTGQTQDAAYFIHHLVNLLLFPRALNFTVTTTIREETKIYSTTGELLNENANENVSEKETRSNIVLTVSNNRNISSIQTLIQEGFTDTHERNQTQPGEFGQIQTTIKTTNTHRLTDAPYLIIEVRSHQARSTVIPEQELIYAENKPPLYLIGIVCYISGTSGLNGHWVSYFVYNSLWYYYDDLDNKPGWDVLDFDMVLDQVKTTGKLYFYQNSETPYYRGQAP